MAVWAEEHELYTSQEKIVTVYYIYTVTWMDVMFQRREDFCVKSSCTCLRCMSSWKLELVPRHLAASTAARPAPVFIEPYTGGVACAAAHSGGGGDRALYSIDGAWRPIVSICRKGWLQCITHYYSSRFFFDPDDFESFFCLSETFVARPQKVTTKIKPTTFLKVWKMN